VYSQKVLIEFEAGLHSVEWDGSNNFGYKVASGVYFYQLKTDDHNVVRKMQLLR
jgi:flagellar hook assembly protein FlgD